MKNSTFAWIVGLILIIGVSGYLYSRSKKSPAVTVTAPASVVQNTDRETIASGPQPAPSSATSPATSPVAPAAASAAPVTVTPSAAPNKAPKIAGASSTPTEITYTNSGLSVQITVPVAWQIREEDTDANNVIFYNGSQIFGTMKVLGASGDSIESLNRDLSADADVMNLIATNVQGIPAFQYMSRSTGTTKIVLVYRGNTYTFEGLAAVQPFIGKLKFI